MPTHPRLITQTPEWLVLDKPPGWLSIPPSRLSGTPLPVLSDWVRSELGPVWAVHRLDVETSGVILFARSPEAHRRAGIWFQRHEAVKHYDCLAGGTPKAPVLRIGQPIEGSPATTQVELKARGAGGFLARVRPLTGKRHQIRIHLAGLGHPLWGDPRYGGPREIHASGGTFPVTRVALHAASLELPSGEKFEAPWPADFAGWVERLREP